MNRTPAIGNRENKVRIAGYGGQGVVLAGMLLGKAASLYGGKHAVFTQAYGPEARGGAANADVIIANEPVGYPLISEPDILVVLFQEAYARFRPKLVPKGTLIMDTDLVHPEEKDRDICLGLPATAIAEELGRKIVANVVILGFLVGCTGIVSEEAVRKAIRTTVKEKTIDLNLRAFDAGLQRVPEECRV